MSEFNNKTKPAYTKNVTKNMLQTGNTQSLIKLPAQSHGIITSELPMLPATHSKGNRF